MRTFTEDEKRTIATTVQGAFLAVHGKRWHSCFWESLSLEQVLRLLDPLEDRYMVKWCLTWFITNKPPGYGEALWDFEERYRIGVKNWYRIPFWHEERQRMAHSFVGLKGEDVQIIDICTDYTPDVLNKYMDIKWPYKSDYIWQTCETLPADLQWWYVPFDLDKLRDLDAQAPPPGLIDSVVEEAWTRLKGLGLSHEK
jgi:hypothetical protein